MGDQGPAVLALQQRLSALGYWLGEPDGKFGPLTQQAVFAIQKVAGVSLDGVVGTATRAALDRGIRPTARVAAGV
ncbi:MAG: peptidoglycan-binding domain-containing protein, partial [Phycicoccus sp.]